MTIMLIGNKKDMDNKRQVQYDEANNFAIENNLQFTEASAQNGDFVEYMFLKTAQMIQNKIDSGDIDPDNDDYGVKKGNVLT